MNKFKIIENDLSDKEVLVKILDESEIEAWNMLMLQGFDKYVKCEHCGADFLVSNFEPLIWTPIDPYKLPVPFNVCYLRCPVCHTMMDEDYVVYGEPFNSITNIGKKIMSGEDGVNPIE